MRLSTHPPSHTPDMFSWFPIYFPLKQPLPCPAGQPITASCLPCSGKSEAADSLPVLQGHGVPACTGACEPGCACNVIEAKHVPLSCECRRTCGAVQPTTRCGTSGQ